MRSNGPILGANDTCVATIMKKAGYDTAHIGKWGLGDIGSSGDPLTKGTACCCMNKNREKERLDSVKVNKQAIDQLERRRHWMSTVY